LSKSPKRAFINKKELAEFLGLSIFTIDSWVSERREIAYVKMGKKVMFDLNDVYKWIENSKILPRKLSEH